MGSQTETCKYAHHEIPNDRPSLHVPGMGIVCGAHYEAAIELTREDKETTETAEPEYDGYAEYLRLWAEMHNEPAEQTGPAAVDGPVRTRPWRI